MGCNFRFIPHHEPFWCRRDDSISNKCFRDDVYRRATVNVECDSLVSDFHHCVNFFRIAPDVDKLPEFTSLIVVVMLVKKLTSLELASEASSVSICLIKTSGCCAFFDCGLRSLGILCPMPDIFLSWMHVLRNRINAFSGSFWPARLACFTTLVSWIAMSYLVYVFGFSARNRLKLRTGCFRTSAYVDAPLTQGGISLLEKSFPQLLASHSKNITCSGGLLRLSKRKPASRSSALWCPCFLHFEDFCPTKFTQNTIKSNESTTLIIFWTKWQHHPSFSDPLFHLAR